MARKRTIATDGQQRRVLSKGRDRVLPARRRRRPPVRRVSADGSSRALRQISLPANAIVRRFDLVVTATRAERVRAMLSADLRTSKGPLGRPAVVVDFGRPRTVSALLLPFAGSGHRAYAWLGTRFDTRAVVLPNTPAGPTERGGEDTGTASYLMYEYPIAETRTERLLLEPGDTVADMEFLMAALELSLPELPADLSLTIEGGLPVWEHPGSVQPGAETAISATAWSSEGKRRIPIAAALEEFAGDAGEASAQTLILELTSSVPGRLAIEVEEQQLSLLHRLRFQGAEQLVLDYASEGVQQLELQLPDSIDAAARLRGLRLTLTGDLPPQRVVPALGPPASGLGELRLGNGRAACVRLDGDSRLQDLGQLTGVRVPLSTVSGGAEARVVLWEDDNGRPLRAVSSAVSAPVSWEQQDEQWISFVFPQPQAFDALQPPWAALIVSRGELSWTLAAASDGERALRIGPPEGPWRTLPAVFGDGTTLGAVAGRIRVVGLAPDTEPFEPMLLTLEGAAGGQVATPTEDGLRLQLEVPPGGDAATNLLVTSHTPGRVTLTEVDAITHA